MAATHTIPTWTIGDRMRKAREAAGLKPSEMAERLGGIHRNNITRWEHSRREPTVATLRKWAEVTGVDLGWLVTGSAPTVTAGKPRRPARLPSAA